MSREITYREQLKVLGQAARHQPILSAGIVVFGAFAALLEGVGLSFIVPIVEIAQGDESAGSTVGILDVFVTIYDAIGVPLSLESAIAGVSIIMVVRYSSTFVVAWLKAKLSTEYEQYLKTQAFDRALDAKIAYFDEEGSDDILNSIITEARYAGRVLQFLVEALEGTFLIIMYLAIAFYLAPSLTVFSLIVLGSVTYITRNVLESGYSVGDRVADANQRVQEAVQAGTQGIRDVKLFGLTDELFSSFQSAIHQFTTASIKRTRNQAAITNFYNLATAVTVFVLIYLAFTFTSLTLGALGLFLFAMFRLSPLVSRLNSKVYQIESYLSHLVRTQAFIAELEAKLESGGDDPAPNPVTSVEFDEVYFSYEGGEPVLKEISFEVHRGEFIAFAGQSGAGKSTIASLLSRMYDVDGGVIRANGEPIEQMDIEKWRSRIAVVRQNPFIFNKTLSDNVLVGDQSASNEEVEQACEVARVTEFLDELPRDYDTLLGDDGVRLSGGQRQRVALARALLKEADVLILDEATSDLDSNLEQEVQEAIESMRTDYLMIAIAHRLSTIRNADRIYTVERGRITEVGRHRELLEMDGRYARMHAVQSREG